MTFLISEKAIHTFKNEWGLKDGQCVRIYAKYVGGGNEAFSVGINVSADPIDPALVKSIGGYQFFVEESDEWILKETLFKIDSNEDGIFFKVE